MCVCVCIYIYIYIHIYIYIYIYRERERERERESQHKSLRDLFCKRVIDYRGRETLKEIMEGLHVGVNI